MSANNQMGNGVSEEEWRREVERLARDTYEKFLAMGLRTAIKVTPSYALIGFRTQDLARAIQERSGGKVEVKVKAKDLGIWITILPSSNRR
ncbi:hypothetical protein [Methanocella conradii]|uniref:hypothetical protein n=1 Tax=Methanocella conradii TaxID=1175444 RepID=UPI00157D57E0|nr:hypothetical protein [Methanocella conradii]